MTLYDFNLLHEEEKYNTLWKKGTYLTSMLEPPYKVNLYAIDLFFVEVYYSHKANKIIQFISFINGNRLDRYYNINSNFIKV